MIFKSKLISNSIIYSVGEILSKALPFLLIPFLFRFLGSEEFGRLSIAQSYIQLISIFLLLSANASISRYYFRYGRRSITLPLISYTIYAIIITIFASIYYVIKFDVFHLLIILIAFTTNLTSVILSIVQSEQKPKSYLKLQSIQILTSLLLTVFFFYFINASVEMRLIAWLLSIVIALAAYFISQDNHFRRNNRKYSINSIFRACIFNIQFGIPLVPHVVSNYIRSDYDKLFLEKYFSLSEIGFYSLGNKIGGITLVIILAINRATQPYIFSYIKTNKRNPPASLLYISLAAIPAITLFAWIIPESIYILIFKYEVKNLVVLFTFANCLLIPYFTVTNIFFYHGKTLSISIISVLSSSLYIAALYGAKIFHNISYIPMANIISNASLSLMIVIIYLKLQNK